MATLSGWAERGGDICEMRTVGRVSYLYLHWLEVTLSVFGESRDAEQLRVATATATCLLRPTTPEIKLCLNHIQDLPYLASSTFLNSFP